MSCMTSYSGNSMSQQAIADIILRPRCALPSPRFRPPALEVFRIPVCACLYGILNDPFCSENGSDVIVLFTFPPKNCPFPLGDPVLHLTHGAYGPPPAWVLSETASRSVQPFLYGSQMLCCTVHCRWGRNPQNWPFHLEFCRRRTKPRPWATCTEKLIKTARVVPEICSRTDRQTHTDRRRPTHHNTSAPLPRAK